MEWIQDNTDFRYIATPTNVDYPIKDNEVHSTYDQFIQLRDTLIFSGKYYNDKAWAKLCVWESKETIEVIFYNLFQQNFEAITDWTAVGTQTIKWPYVSWDETIATNISTPMCCVIQKDGRYKIIHKEEVLPVAWSKKVYCYVDIYREDANWTITIWDKKYSMPYKWWVAVFDWQWEFEKTFSWSTSWTEPNWSCSVKVSFKMWDIFQKVTAFGYMERNLLKWDILVLRAKDAEADPSTWEPQWNDLAFQPSSNYWSIEYLNLPIN